MDKHICKAKRVNTGEWVYGYYFERKDTLGNVIESVIIEDAYEQIHGGLRLLESMFNKECFRVDPDTVCQFTGKVDKNNKPIFENDIVIGKANIPMLVRWDELNACFEVVYKVDGIGWCSNIMCDSARLEVIGNKFDNAKLME